MCEYDTTTKGLKLVTGTIVKIGDCNNYKMISFFNHKILGSQERLKAIHLKGFLIMIKSNVATISNNLDTDIEEFHIHTIKCNYSGHSENKLLIEDGHYF